MPLKALALALMLAACGQTGEPLPPTKPREVPASAFWCGGADGGVFIDIRRNGKTNRYQGAVYADTGYLWYRGAFLLEPTTPETKPPDLKSAWCGGWDGTYIHIVGGGALLAEGLQGK